MAGKQQQYTVVRAFSRSNRRGPDTAFKVGDDYTGPIDKPYLLDEKGPDGRGPLLAVKTEEPAPAPTEDSTPKESK